uniref:Uncharacterized protein n=1 Tax=Oryza glumipatula TaxID=40148 RepID=A0A0E0AUE7_9ORYZ
MASSTGTRKPVPTQGGGSSSGVSTGTNQGGDDPIGTSHPVPPASFTGGLAQSMSHYIYTTSTCQAGGGCHKGKVKGHSNSKPEQHGTTNHGNSYKENNDQSTASSYYNGSSKSTSTGRMPEQQNSDHQYYINSMGSNHGQQGGGGAQNSTYTSKSIRTKKFPSLNG